MYVTRRKERNRKSFSFSLSFSLFLSLSASNSHSPHVSLTLSPESVNPAVHLHPLRPMVLAVDNLYAGGSWQILVLCYDNLPCLLQGLGTLLFILPLLLQACFQFLAFLGGQGGCVNCFAFFFFLQCGNQLLGKN